MRIFIFLVILLWSCNIDTTGFNQVSDTIEESKNLGVFCYSLKPNKAVVNLRNHEKDTIQEAWVEYQWQYKSHNLFFTKLVKDSIQQLAIRFHQLPRIGSDLPRIWLKSGETYFAWMNNISQTSNEINADSSIYIIYHSMSSHNTTVLDSFRLRR